MPNISQRGVDMPASPIRKLAPLADAARQRGVHVGCDPDDRSIGVGIQP